MLIIGESINGSIAEVEKAISSRDDNFIINLARYQLERGAQMVDVNAKVPGGNEIEDLVWAVKAIQEKFDICLMLDSGNPDALRAAMKIHRGRPIINSLSGEKWKLDKLLPLATESDCGVVVLCLDEDGIPSSPEGRLKLATQIINYLTAVGIKEEDIYLDPIVLSVATDFEAVKNVLETLRLIQKNLPEINTIMAISNVSFGLPCRRLLNRTFLSFALVLGLDAFIVDVRDKSLMATIWAINLLMGQDEGCRSYLKAYRQGILE